MEIIGQVGTMVCRLRTSVLIDWGNVPRPKMHDTREAFIAEFVSLPEFPAYVTRELPGKRRPSGSIGGLPPKGDQGAQGS